MTAPAEDPRGGEAWRPVCGCEQGMGHMDRGCHSYGLCHAQSAERAARPAGDRAQPTEELREAIARGLGEAWITAGPRAWDEQSEARREGARHLADAILVLPAVAALLDAQAAVNRVEAAINRHADNLTPTQRAAFTRALDGTT